MAGVTRYIITTTRQCKCWCCEKPIPPKTHLVRFIYTNRYGGPGYVNVCKACLGRLATSMMVKSIA